jgi:dihydroxyacetone kinase-like protein
MEIALQRKLISTVATTVIERADELTVLDQAIGDGDHGLNMKRGFEAVLAQLDALSDQPLPQAITAIGNTMVMKVGGASGPLYGTLFMVFGRELPIDPTSDEIARAFGLAIEAVKKIGKSDVGQKTLLDVLVPVRDELAAGGEGLRLRVRQRAMAAAESTIPMKAIKGRASFLGERSIGHMDPGARSSSLMIGVVCEVLEG